jgi:hypothetical protein
MFVFGPGLRSSTLSVIPDRERLRMLSCADSSVHGRERVASVRWVRCRSDAHRSPIMSVLQLSPTPSSAARSAILAGFGPRRRTTKLGGSAPYDNEECGRSGP